VDDRDFYRALSASPERAEAGAAFLRALMKTAQAKKPPQIAEMRARVNSLLDTVQAIRKTPKKLVAPPKSVKLAGAGDFFRGMAVEMKHLYDANKPELIGGAIGAAAGGAYGYFSAKRRDPKKPSSLEREGRAMQVEYERDMADLRRKKEKPGLGHKLEGVSIRAFRDMAKIMKDHPVAAGALYGGAGGAAGPGIARFIHDQGREMFTEGSLDL
jgi:hypothetical protein